jgi:5'-methylthioadenosine phosphorylase
MATDYDCWHPEHDHVTVEAVVKVLLANAEKGRALVKAAVPKLAGRAGLCEKGCHRSLDHAIITAKEARDPALLRRLDAVAGRVLK